MDTATQATLLTRNLLLQEDDIDDTMLHRTQHRPLSGQTTEINNNPNCQTTARTLRMEHEASSILHDRNHHQAILHINEFIHYC